MLCCATCRGIATCWGRDSHTTVPVRALEYILERVVRVGRSRARYLQVYADREYYISDAIERLKHTDPEGPDGEG